jgi:hypothetical protein
MMSASIAKRWLLLGVYQDLVNTNTQPQVLKACHSLNPPSEFATFVHRLMSSIRIKKVRAPLAYVPVRQGQVAVVPTDELPSLEHRGSPVNQEFLVEHARGLAGTSSTAASTHSAPRPEYAASIPPSTARRRSRTLGALETAETSARTKIRPISSASNFQRRSRAGSGSWFVDHVANSSAGLSSVLQFPSQAPPAPLAQGRTSVASNATLEVIIPEDVRAGLVGTLQNGNSSFNSLESGIHPDDIVDHLSVIGTPSI